MLFLGWVRGEVVVVRRSKRVWVDVMFPHGAGIITCPHEAYAGSMRESFLIVYLALH